MGIYDTTIKTLFTQYPGRSLRRIIGIPDGAEPLPTEFTRVEFVDDAVSPRAGERVQVTLSSEGGGSAGKARRTSRGPNRVVLAQSLEVDFVARTRRRGIATFVHVEFQSAFQASMPSRMLLYRAGIIDRYGKWTKDDPWVPEVAQVIVNLCKDPWGQKAGLATQTLTLGYKVHDLCTLDASDLLDDGDPADAVVSLLCRKGLAPRNLDRMIKSIGSIPDRRAMRNHLAMALALAKLRDARRLIERTIERMPINLDLSDCDLLRRPIDAAYEQGARSNAVTTLIMLVEDRFGLGSGADLDVDDLDAGDVAQLSRMVHRATSVSQLAEHAAEMTARAIKNDI